MGERKKPGPKPIAEHLRKDRNLTFRVRLGMRERLEAAASENGRSISEEIEARLAASFEGADMLAAIRSIVREEINGTAQQPKT